MLYLKQEDWSAWARSDDVLWVVSRVQEWSKLASGKTLHQPLVEWAPELLAIWMPDMQEETSHPQESFEELYRDCLCNQYRQAAHTSPGSMDTEDVRPNLIRGVCILVGSWAISKVICAHYSFPTYLGGEMRRNFIFRGVWEVRVECIAKTFYFSICIWASWTIRPLSVFIAEAKTNLQCGQ